MTTTVYYSLEVYFFVVSIKNLHYMLSSFLCDFGFLSHSLTAVEDQCFVYFRSRHVMMSVIGNFISSMVIIFCLKLSMIPSSLWCLCLERGLTMVSPLLLHHVQHQVHMHPFTVAVLKEFNVDVTLPFCLEVPIDICHIFGTCLGK